MASYILFSILLCIFRPFISGVPGVHGVPLEYQTEIEQSYQPVQDAHRGYTKHTAALAIGSQMVWHVCGASIIRHNFMMTAGHCIEPLLDWDKNVLPTSHAIVGTDEWNKGGIRLRIKHYYLHPNWDYVFLKNDMGLLQLFDKIVLSDKVGIIAMNFNWVDGGEDAYVTAHDHSEVSVKQQILHVLSITPQQCVDGVYAAGGRWAPPVHSDIEICARNHHWHGKGPCNGDGGSALVLQKKKQLIGVRSWGFGCQFNAPTVFVRISKFKDYIYSIIKDHH